MRPASPSALPNIPQALLAPPPESVKGMTGARKAAILLACLGDQASAPVLRLLSEEEVHDITRELTLLRNIPDEERKAVLLEFDYRATRHDYLASGGLEYATQVLVAAFGPENGKRMAERLLKSIGREMPNIDSLRRANPERLAKVIHREHPQTIALVLCHLGTMQAAQLLGALPTELQSEVARRMAALDQISPEVVNRIAKSIGAKLRMLGESSLEAYGGVRAVAEVLNRVEGSMTDRILEGISTEDPTLEQAIRHLMFVFEDLVKVSPEALRSILGRVDRKVLTLALKGCNPEVKNLFTGLMSARAAEMLNEDMQALGPVRIKDVEEAQQKIIAVARQLQAEGLVSLSPGAEERFVE